MKKIMALFILILCIIPHAYAASPVFAFEDAEYSVQLGFTMKLNPIAQRINGKLTYSWSSSDEKIATVYNGTVKGVSGGIAEITCNAKDIEGNSYKAVCKVMVTVPIKTIKTDKTSITLASAPRTAFYEYKEGDSIKDCYYAYKPNIVIEPEDATYTDLTWSSADAKIASVTDDGVIFGQTAGTTIVTGKAKDGSQRKVQITVTVPKCFVTEDNVTITDPSGATIMYKFANSYKSGITTYSMKQTGKAFSVESISNGSYIDGEMTTLKIRPIKAGNGTVSFIRNGSVVKTINVKVEHSAVYDEISYPPIKVSELLLSQEDSIGKKTQVTCEVFAIEPFVIDEARYMSSMYNGKYSGLLYGKLEEKGQRRYVIIEHAGALLLEVGETYTIYGEVEKFVEYTSETGLVYECPYFVRGHINSENK